MNDLIEALKNRVSSPIFGYFGLAVLVINWRGFFFLFAQESDALGRIKFFDSNTSFISLAIEPALISLALAIIYPWLNYIVAWITAKPAELKDLVQATSEQKMLKKRRSIANEYSNILADSEKEIIARAKRDQELDSLQDQESRVRAKSDLDILRKKYDALIDGAAGQSVVARHKELMDLADGYRERSDSAIQPADKARFLQSANDLEQRANLLLMKSGIMNIDG